MSNEVYDASNWDKVLCPVCEGVGKLAGDFYYFSTIDGSTPDKQTKCKSCYGCGYINVPPKHSQPNVSEEKK